MVGTLEAENNTKIIEVHTMVGEQQSSWVGTFKRLLENDIIVYGVKTNNKNRKRKKEQK